MGDAIVLSRRGGVVTLTLNRPGERNMLSDEIIDRLNNHLLVLEKDQSVRVLILRGKGREFFCGGVFNPIQKAKLSSNQTRLRRRRANELFDRIESLVHPVIAAINGRAQAGGLEMALACDIRVAASHATFALPESSWGGFPGAGGPIRLPRIVGMGKAMEIMMTGRDVKSSEALRIGLVEQVFPSERFHTKVRQFAEVLASTSPLGNRAIKQMVRSFTGMNMSLARPYSDVLRDFVSSSLDATEGMAAYREGRPPRFRGD